MKKKNIKLELKKKTISNLDKSLIQGGISLGVCGSILCLTIAVDCYHLTEDPGQMSCGGVYICIDKIK